MFALSRSVSSPGRGEKANQSLMSRTIEREIYNAAAARIEMKDVTSSKLQVNGPRQADAVKRAELLVLRNEIKALPEGLREDARTNYLLAQNIKRKDLQDLQCAMISRLEVLLRKSIQETGADYQKYKIGGNDKCTYERFFRVEPGRYMTKAQFTTALRRSFGDQLLKSESAVCNLFDTFDFKRTDEMDWRAFLYMLAILMQPYLYCDALMRCGYAIYSSVGSLDMDCREPLSLGMAKDMLCVAITLSLRSEIRYTFDLAWQHLAATDTDTIQYTARKLSTVAARAADPDELKIPFRMIQKILTQTVFKKYMETCTVFGKKDPRTWTCVLEEKYYHPAVLNQLKALRRETRSNAEADKFIAMRERRCKIFALNVWKGFTKRRNYVRYVLVGGDVRTQQLVFSVYFDHWRKMALESFSQLLLQRCVRGFIARKRRDFMKRLQYKALLIQSNARQGLARRRYNQRNMRIQWAVMTIQRIARGTTARKRVATIVAAMYDTKKRKLEQEKREYLLWRQNRAASALQMSVRRFLLHRRLKRAVEQMMRIEDMQALMSKEAEAARVKEVVFKKQLSDWYIQRKTAYDEAVFNEKQTIQQRKAIVERRNRAAELIKQQKQQLRDEQQRKLEEEQMALWVQNWEEQIVLRGKVKRAKLQAILKLCETPDDVRMKADLLKRVKEQIKDVLRRADKMRIPMEIPEATVVATKEIIELECEEELVRAREEMTEEAAANKIAAEEKARRIKEQEEIDKRRRRKWAVITMQGYIRAFIAKKVLRMRAYRRYIKHFDIASHEYFYEDPRTGTTSWTKPKCLGLFDIPMEDYWVVMRAKGKGGEPITAVRKAKKTDNNNNDNSSHASYESYNKYGKYNNNSSTEETAEEIEPDKPLVYYYNPSTWIQTWDLPGGTVLCEICSIDFATTLLNSDRVKYCDNCFYTQVQKLINNGYPPRQITYKIFKGGRTDAIRTNFHLIMNQNWLMHSMHITDDFKLTEDEERAENKKAKLKAKMLKKQKKAQRDAEFSAQGAKMEKGKRKNLATNSNMAMTSADALAKELRKSGHHKHSKHRHRHNDSEESESDGKNKMKKRKHRRHKSKGNSDDDGSGDGDSSNEKTTKNSKKKKERKEKSSETNGRKKSTSTKAVTSPPLCSICEDNNAALECKECNKLYCEVCSSLAHTSATTAFHEVIPYISISNNNMNDRCDSGASSGADSATSAVDDNSEKEENTDSNSNGYNTNSATSAVDSSITDDDDGESTVQEGSTTQTTVTDTNHKEPKRRHHRHHKKHHRHHRSKSRESKDGDDGNKSEASGLSSSLHRHHKRSASRGSSRPSRSQSRSRSSDAGHDLNAGKKCDASDVSGNNSCEEDLRSGQHSSSSLRRKHHHHHRHHHHRHRSRSHSRSVSPSKEIKKQKNKKKLKESPDVEEERIRNNDTVSPSAAAAENEGEEEEVSRETAVIDGNNNSKSEDTVTRRHHRHHRHRSSNSVSTERSANKQLTRKHHHHRHHHSDRYLLHDKEVAVAGYDNTAAEGSRGRSKHRSPERSKSRSKSKDKKKSRSRSRSKHHHHHSSDSIAKERRRSSSRSGTKSSPKTHHRHRHHRSDNNDSRSSNNGSDASSSLHKHHRSHKSHRTRKPDNNSVVSETIVDGNVSELSDGGESSLSLAASSSSTKRTKKTTARRRHRREEEIQTTGRKHHHHKRESSSSGLRNNNSNSGNEKEGEEDEEKRGRSRSRRRTSSSHHHRHHHHSSRSSGSKRSRVRNDNRKEDVDTSRSRSRSKVVDSSSGDGGSDVGEKKAKQHRHRKHRSKSKDSKRGRSRNKSRDKTNFNEANERATRKSNNSDRRKIKSRSRSRERKSAETTEDNITELQGRNNDAAASHHHHRRHKQHSSGHHSKSRSRSRDKHSYKPTSNSNSSSSGNEPIRQYGGEHHNQLSLHSTNSSSNGTSAAKLPDIQQHHHQQQVNNIKQSLQTEQFRLPPLVEKQ